MTFAAISPLRSWRGKWLRTRIAWHDFSAEAEALAALNHPNIAAIYAVEGAALVLELVEGPTLADRIAQGAMLPEDALPVARQLIDALEYAHEKGWPTFPFKFSDPALFDAASGVLSVHKKGKAFHAERLDGEPDRAVR